jgi:capsular exopolysaccharide synthesis family protein
MKHETNLRELASISPGLPAGTSHGRVNRQLVRSIGPTTSAALDDGISPAFVWRVFSQWWKLVVPLGVLFAAAASAIVWHFHVPQFMAKALVKIEADAPFIAFEDGVASPQTDRYVQTQIELMRSAVVLSPLLSRPEIASINEIKSVADPVAFLQEQLSVSQVNRSELYQVCCKSPSPEDAATIANATVAEYLVTQNREDKERSQIVIDVLEKERLERRDKVQQLREHVVNLAKELTGKDPFGQGVITDVTAFTSATSIYQSLTEVDVNIEMLKAELQALRNAPIIAADKAAAAGLLDLEISNRTDVRRLETRIANLKDSLAVVKSKPRRRIGETWEHDPEYRQLSELLRLASEQLPRLREAAGRELMNQYRERKRADQLRMIVTKEEELNLLMKKRELLTKKFADQQLELKAGGAKSTELEFAKGELAREERVFELIAARKLALQTEQRAPARVTLMQSAKVPSTSLEPIPYKLLLLACMASLASPFALAMAYELIVRRVSGPEQLAKESLLPVLGEVARFPIRRVTATQHALPLVQQRQLLIYAESIDSLRTNLMLTEQVGVPGQPRVIAICSAASGEGKTSVATSLAMSIAEATMQPTLVLDADLRSPEVGTFLEVPNEPGITEVFSGKAEIEHAIHRVGETLAYVLPAGKGDVNPHHVLQGSKIDELLSTLREKFSTIVIDTPPILAASEALVYAKAADLVVFCSLADVSRAKQVRMAVDRLHATGANIAGAVLSGVPFNQYVHRYGAYSHSG